MNTKLISRAAAIYNSIQTPNGIFPIFFKGLTTEEAVNLCLTLVQMAINEKRIKELKQETVMLYLAHVISLPMILSTTHFTDVGLIRSEETFALVLEYERELFETRHLFAKTVILYFGLSSQMLFFRNDPRFKEAKNFYREFSYYHDGLFQIVFESFEDCIIIVNDVKQLMMEMSNFKKRCTMSIAESIESSIHNIISEIDYELQSASQPVSVELIRIRENGDIEIRLIGSCNAEKVKRRFKELNPSIKEVIIVPFDFKRK